ncbi:MAG: glycosyltransferase [Proteobacteria bacterium]|nr:glycosyltransferase [Pseudomonadota bacterium]
MPPADSSTVAPLGTQTCVLQVTAALGGEGGVERGTLEMANYITQRGWRSIVASAGGVLVEGVLRGGSEHIEMPLAAKSPAAIFANALKLKNLIRENNVSIVHARSRAPAWAAYMACKMTGTPFVTTFHGTYGLQSPLKKHYNSVMVRGRKVIAISNFIAEHIMRNYGVQQHDIHVAHRGFDPRVFDPEKIDNATIENLWARWNIAAHTPVIVLPGRLTRWKGHEAFIRALGTMKGMAWRAVIVGGFDRKQTFYWQMQELTRKLGIDERVIFHGSSDNMPAIYAAADIVVSASIEPEAFGRVAVEGQAMGRPVIATAHGGSLETVKQGETGWLVKPADVPAMALALTDAVTTDLKKLRKMGEKGREWVSGHFTTEKMCAAEFATYQQILSPQEAEGAA